MSVVVPAYNVEGFITAALDSLLSQPRAAEVELIIVDDGATDSTYERIEEVRSRHADKDIKVIRQKNGGLSVARNVGIAAVTTPYIGYLDADDLLHPDFCKIILPLVEQQAADIIEFDVRVMNLEGELVDHLKLLPPGAQGYTPGGMPALMEFANVCQNFAFARVYRRELWDGVPFPPGRVYEDFAIIPGIYTKARSLYRVAEELYIYRRRRDSITYRASAFTVHCLGLCAEEALERSNVDKANEAYWMTIFDKAFRYMCLEASKTPRKDHREAEARVRVVADKYSAHAAGRTLPPVVKYRRRLFLDRRMFQAKQIVKRFVLRAA
jgi:glycosyltransferase involved in cell wall biosynthesis